MGISLAGDIFGLVDSGGSCISTVAMVRACEAIQARLVATLSIMQRTPCCGFHFLLSPSSHTSPTLRSVRRSSELSGPTLVNTSNVVLKATVMPEWRKILEAEDSDFGGGA